MTAIVPGSASVHSLLDLDPELGSGIQDSEWNRARLAISAELLTMPRGDWAVPGPHAGRDDIVGLIVSEGVLGREIALSGHHMLELLCRGDALLRPEVAEGSRFGSHVSLCALCDTTVMVVGASFIRAAARWPCLLANLHCRLEAQRERLAIQGLTAHLPRAADRLLLTLWLLAESCGRVTPEGTVVPLTLTHDTLGRLTAARRPTVTLALRALEAGGFVRRRPEGHLILTAAAEDEVAAITRTSSHPPMVGTSIRLDARQHHAEQPRKFSLVE